MIIHFGGARSFFTQTLQPALLAHQTRRNYCFDHGFGAQRPDDEGTIYGCASSRLGGCASASSILSSRVSVPSLVILHGEQTQKQGTERKKNIKKSPCIRISKIRGKRLNHYSPAVVSFAERTSLNFTRYIYIYFEVTYFIHILHMYISRIKIFSCSGVSIFQYF